MHSEFAMMGNKTFPIWVGNASVLMQSRSSLFEQLARPLDFSMSSLNRPCMYGDLWPNGREDWAVIGTLGSPSIISSLKNPDSLDNWFSVTQQKTQCLLIYSSIFCQTPLIQWMQWMTMVCVFLCMWMSYIEREREWQEYNLQTWFTRSRTLFNRLCASFTRRDSASALSRSSVVR